MKTYLQSRVIRMDKRENLLQFLDYGGNELFSSLMESDSDRPQALDRMCILLRKAVIFGKPNGIYKVKKNTCLQADSCRTGADYRKSLQVNRCEIFFQKVWKERDNLF